MQKYQFVLAVFRAKRGGIPRLKAASDEGYTTSHPCCPQCPFRDHSYPDPVVGSNEIREWKHCERTRVSSRRYNAWSIRRYIGHMSKRQSQPSEGQDSAQHESCGNGRHMAAGALHDRGNYDSDETKSSRLHSACWMKHSAVVWVAVA